MGRPYYYLVASLPTLFFNAPPLISHEAFLETCRAQMTPEDFAAIQKSTLDADAASHGDNPALKQWSLFNRQLKNEIAYFRAVKSGKNPAEFIRGERFGNPRMMDIIKQAARSENPLEAQIFLDRFRWDYLEELSTGQFFNLEFCILYGLKLQILEYYIKIKTSSKGRELFEEYKNSALDRTRELVKA